MAVPDIILALFLCYGLFRGFINGFFIEIASLVSIVIGIYAAIKFSSLTGDFLGKHLSWNPYAIKIMAFALTFLIVLIAISLLAKFLSTIAAMTGLGLFNKISGALLGMLKMVLILGIAISFLEKINDGKALVSAETEEKSILYQPVKKTAAVVYPLFDKLIAKAKPVISTP